MPSSAARASVVGAPSRVVAQPSGIGLPSRDLREREVDHERLAVAPREHGGNRIGAEQRTAAAPGGHRRGRIAEGERNQARRAERRQMRRAHPEMVAALHARHGAAELPCPVDQGRHCEIAGGISQPVRTVDQYRRATIRHDCRLRHGIDAAIAQLRTIHRQPRYPVRRQSAQVGVDERARGRFGGSL
jgi:hypothetical protein